MNARQRVGGLLRSRSGQSLVEFAMVLPLMLVVMFIITEFGRALWIKNELTQAAREGARAAVVSTVASGAKIGVATNRTNDFLTESGMKGGTDPAPVVVAENFTLGGRNYLRVQVTRDFSFVPSGEMSANPFGAGAVVIPTGFPIQAEVIMKHE